MSDQITNDGAAAAPKAAVAPVKKARARAQAKPAADPVLVALKATEERLAATLQQRLTAETTERVEGHKQLRDEIAVGHKQLRDEIATGREQRKRFEAEVQQQLAEIPGTVSKAMAANIVPLVLGTIKEHNTEIVVMTIRETASAPFRWLARTVSWPFAAKAAHRVNAAAQAAPAQAPA